MKSKGFWDTRIKNWQIKDAIRNQDYTEVQEEDEE